MSIKNTESIYLSILLSFDIESESLLPFFIANGVGCATAVEFRRLTVNALLLVDICKAALELRRRGGESFELPATK